jgi:C4-dicarboxylate transporter DctQ subunit
MIIKMLNRAEETIIGLLLVAMTLLVFIEVVLRFGFGTGFIWSQELTLHLSAWFVLFGVSYGLKIGAHIGVDALVKKLPPPVRRITAGIAVLLSLAYCGLFIYGGWIYLAKMEMIGIELEDLPIQTWQAHSILVIGMVFLTVRLLELFWKVITAQSDGFVHTDEAKHSMSLAEELKQEQNAAGGKN